MSLTILQLNQFSQAEFTQTIGSVFEHSTWIAELTWARQPFASLEELHHALCQTVKKADEARQLALIRAHPDLVGKLALAGQLTSESTREQASAGLAKLSPDEVELFQRQNAAYKDKFGFPFVICARLNKKEAILNGFASRLKNSREAEMKTALEEIYKIAELRLRDLISNKMSAKLSTHVLDTANGCPAAGMKIELWSLADGQSKMILTVQTNADGRTEAPLLGAADMKAGQYELVFFVGDYFASKSAAMSQPRFLDRVPVRFSIADATVGYHVPLLCSPWSYSTYRGS